MRQDTHKKKKKLIRVSLISTLAAYITVVELLHLRGEEGLENEEFSPQDTI